MIVVILEKGVGGGDVTSSCRRSSAATPLTDYLGQRPKFALEVGVCGAEQ